MYSSHFAAFEPNPPVSVPPEYATITVFPWSFTGKVYDNVPGVCPGVGTIFTVVSPSVSFMPSAPTVMSRFGTPPAAVAGR